MLDVLGSEPEAKRHARIAAILRHSFGGPLHHAAKSGHFECVQATPVLLLPLLYGVFWMQMLVASRMDITLKNQGGNTALTLAERAFRESEFTSDGHQQ